MFRKVFIANRGEIAVRIARAAARLGVRSVAAYSRDDDSSPHRHRADEAVALEGSGPAAYLDVDAVVAAAQAAGCDAVHPGYGFLSENAAFARRCAQRGLVFIGPRPEVLDLFGDKAAARRLAAQAGVPVSRGSSQAVSLEEAVEFLRSLEGGAMMVKALNGGGGRGMRLVEDEAQLAHAYEQARSEARAAFGSDAVYVEEFISPARHVEVQVAGDLQGSLVHLHERECSLQRRHQKLVEFAPAPNLPQTVREGMAAAALTLARAAGVHALCTFEFLLDAAGRFVFIEANARLQVEHTVTEEVLGIDLVEAQFRLAAGEPLAAMHLTQQEIGHPRGMAVQLRVNLERVDDQGQGWPASGSLRAFDPPGGAGVRVDTFVRAGYTPPATFDSLAAKLIVHARTGDLADVLRAAYRALCEFRIDGIDTNLGLLRNLVRHPEVVAGRFGTRFIESHAAQLARDGQDHALLYGPEADAGDGAGQGPAAAGIEVPAGAGVLPAPLGGRLVRWLAAEGDAVAAGQCVAVIEAMKMEHEVTVQESGRVLQLLHEPGASLSGGAPLLLLEPGEFGAGSSDSAANAGRATADTLVEALRARKDALLDAQRAEAVARQHDRGMLTARERISCLCDAGSFVEFGGLVQADNAAFAPADGLVLGSARIDGRPVMVLSQDFSVFGGSSGALGKAKILRTLARCRTNGLPLVMLFDGGGHRIQDGQNSRYYAQSNTVFQEFSRLSGWVPVAAAVLGMGYAANTNFCAMADLVVMVRGKSEMGLAGPALVKAGTGAQVTGQQLGGAGTQVDRHGLADLGVDSEEEAFAAIRRFLSYLPSNAGVAPPLASFEAPPAGVLGGLVPVNTRQSYDMRRVVEHIADAGSVFEIKPTFGGNLVTALARMGGRAVGFIANQPLVKSGTIDADAAEKGAHFIAICDAYGLPLIYLVDVPGVLIGPEAEKVALGKRSAKLLFELGHATVPRMSVIIRKGYGLGYVAMCGGRGFDADISVAWPTAEICAMSIEGSVDVAYRKKYQDAPDPAARRAEIVAAIRAQVSAVQAAEGFGIDDVIEPEQTRPVLLEALSQAPARRPSTMPPKVRSIPPI